MRFDELDLVRYGHFSEYRIKLPKRQPDYFVLFGQNEAGKSTLLRGISALLFGVPSRTPDTHSCKGPELRIGGTVSINGTSFSFRRRKGTTGTLLSQDERQIQEDELGAFLRGLDRDQFEQFFGLDHLRLRSGGEELLRGEGDVGSSLFQAAGLDLRRVLEGINNEAKELFSPKARTRVIGTALENYRQARLEIRRIALSAGAVKQKREELDQARQRKESLDAEADDVRQKLTRLNRIASNKPDVARLQELRARLTMLESVPNLPANIRSVRDETIAILSAATREIDLLKARIEQCDERMKALAIDSRLKSFGPKIEDLNARLQDYLRQLSDRPKREAEHREAVRLAENEWREVWNRLPISDAEKLRAVYSNKVDIRGLMTEHTRITTAHEEAEQSLDSARLNFERLSNELSSRPDPADPSALVAAIEQSKKLGDTEEIVARMEVEIGSIQSALVRELKSLPLWSRSVEELEVLKVPLPSTVEQYSRKWQSFEDDEQELSRALLVQNTTIARHDTELARLGTNVRAVSENELAEERNRRDKIWSLIRQSKFEQSISDEDAHEKSQSSVPLPGLFGLHLHRCDEIADVRFSNAKDVVMHDRLVKEITAARTERDRIEAQVQQLTNQQSELLDKWQMEWNALGADPLSPSEMEDWLQRRARILERFSDVKSKENELASFRERIKSFKSDVLARLRDLGHQTLKDDDSLVIVLSVAQQFARAIENERHAIRDLNRELKSIQIEKQKSKLADCRSRLATWSERWAPLVGALLLPESTTPEHAGKALDILEKVFSHVKDADNLTHRIKRMSENIREFENDALQLASQLDHSLASLAPDQITAKLHDRINEYSNAETVRREVELQRIADDKSLKEQLVNAEHARTSLTKLMETAKAESESQLESVITSIEERSEKKRNYDEIARALVARNGSSDLKVIEKEASIHELDALHTEISRLEQREEELRSELFQAGQEYGRLQEEFERVENGEEAALQAQRAEDALAKARTATAQYLRLKIAAEVLQRAMDSYREKHQGPILRRASELFSRLTLGEHSGLTTGFGDDDKPVLVAVRSNKEQVGVSGLSDGTRDQLYLALRLSAIEHHVSTVGPCPLIFDDILINSDDARAAAALESLAELALKTQVLVFTHHARIAEIATSAGARIIELGKQISATA